MPIVILLVVLTAAALIILLSRSGRRKPPNQHNKARPHDHPVIEGISRRDIKQDSALPLLGPVRIMTPREAEATEVICDRIWNILDQGLAGPEQILVICQTISSAQRLIAELEARTNLKGNAWWIGTFPSLSARLIDMDPLSYGLSRDDDPSIGPYGSLAIVTKDDQHRIIESASFAINGTVPTQEQIDETALRISRLKQLGILPSQAEESPDKALYTRYQETLNKADACDTDDLVLRPAWAWTQDSELARNCRDKFRFMILNGRESLSPVENTWLNLMLNEEHNILIVNDPPGLDIPLPGLRTAQI